VREEGRACEVAGGCNREMMQRPGNGAGTLVAQSEGTLQSPHIHGTPGMGGKYSS